MGIKKPNPERKSRRVSVLCKPSAHEALEKIAYVKEESINNLINMAILEFISTHTMDIQRYDQLEGVD